MQDNYGAWEDTLKALWTLPSIPLIARLFPGKTASEFYHNNLANDLRPSLLSIKHQQSGLTKSAGKASLLNKLLEQLTIIHTVEGNEEKRMETRRRLVKKRAAVLTVALTSPLLLLYVHLSYLQVLICFQY